MRFIADAFGVLGAALFNSDDTPDTVDTVNGGDDVDTLLASDSSDVISNIP